MKQMIIFLMTLVLIPSGPLVAEEFLVVMEIHMKEVFGERSLDDVESKMIVSMETNAQLNQPFRAKIRNGFHIHTMKGKLTQKEDGQYMLDIGLRAEKESQVLLHTLNGLEPVIGLTALNSTIGVQIGKAVDIGGTRTANSDFNKPLHKVSQNFTVNVVRVRDVNIADRSETEIKK
ncbi:hypothetical protein [Lacunimicrobium album]